VIAIELYLAFIAATVVLMVIPGPNVALIVANSVAHGTRFGLLTVAATSTAVVVHLTLTVIGAAAVLNFLAASFDWLRWAGVAYLVYLGIATWRAPVADLAQTQPQARSGRLIFARGFLVGLTNSQNPAVLWRVLPAVHHARPRCRPAAPAARSDVPRGGDRVRQPVGDPRRAPARPARRPGAPAQPDHRRAAGRRGAWPRDGAAPMKTGPARAPFTVECSVGQTGMFCCATMQYSMPIENMVLKRLA